MQIGLLVNKNWFRNNSRRAWRSLSTAIHKNNSLPWRNFAVVKMNETIELIFAYSGGFGGNGDSSIRSKMSANLVGGWASSYNTSPHLVTGRYTGNTQMSLVFFPKVYYSLRRLTFVVTVDRENDFVTRVGKTRPLSAPANLDSWIIAIGNKRISSTRDNVRVVPSDTIRYSFSRSGSNSDLGLSSTFSRFSSCFDSSWLRRLLRLKYPPMIDLGPSLLDPETIDFN